MVVHKIVSRDRRLHGYRCGIDDDQHKGTRRINTCVSRDRRRLVKTIPAEDVPPRLTGRDVGGAWILTALLFLGFAILM